MIDPAVVKEQLKRIGAPSTFWTQPEIDELPHVLMEGEEIQHLLNGHYAGGFAVLCATNLRLLLIDKKLFFMTLEDIRYDMIAELDYGHQMLGATIHIRSLSKELKFQSFRKMKLREFTTFVQHKVMALRQQQPAVASNNSMIPLQTFEDAATGLTPAQAQSVIPLSVETWYKANPPIEMVNPYAQTPLMTRRRVGRFDLVGKS